MVKTWSTELLIDLLTVSLGIFATFAFAPYGYYPLAVLAMAGLILSLLGTSPKRGFLRGYAFGLGFFGLGVYWVFNSIHYIGELPPIPSVLITALLVCFLSLYPALVGYALSRYFPQTTGSKILCYFPTIWIISEWFRSWILTGFPWLLIGYSQTNSPLRGFAPIFMVYGVSLAVCVSAGLLVNVIYQYRQLHLKHAALSAVSIVMIWIAGFFLTNVTWTEPQAKTISVSIVQGNIPQTLKWDPEHLQLSLDRYVKMTEPLWGKSNIIIWPESAVPIPLQSAPDFINSLQDKAINSNSTLILGIPVQADDGSGYYNAIIALGKDRQFYFKRRLVPYGEYVPFSKYFANLFDIMKLPMSNMVAGSLTQEPLNIDQVKILPSICYEVIFPIFMQSHDPNLGFLLTVSNDAWFGYSSAQAQHLQMASMAALSLGRPMLFSSNDGITAIIAPNGKVISEAPTRQEAIIRGIVHPTQGLTPYMRFGTDPVFFVIFCLFLIPFSIEYFKRRFEKQKVNIQEASEE